MKKYLMLAPILALAATGAFALDVGVGLFLSTLNATDRNTVGGYSSGTSYGSYDYKDEIQETGFGLFGSIGWKYLDIYVGFLSNTNTTTRTWTYLEPTVSYDDFDYRDRWGKNSDTFAFLAGLYLKVPITVSRLFRFYPVIGSDFTIGDDYNIGVRTQGGLGADFLVFRNMFIRANALYGYDFFREGHGLVIKAGAGWMF
jgi:hypothetical protein